MDDGIIPQKVSCKTGGKKGNTYYNTWSSDWGRAYQGYNYWSETKCSMKKLQAYLGVSERVSIKMQQKFREGWIPMQDKDFMEVFNYG